MIKKFLEIDNLGVFKDFRWDNALPEFKKFNLIYGLNGSGKTTLTHLFSALKSGQSADYPDLKYQIETESGEYSQDMKYPRKIKVFNKQYVSDNINFLECNTKPILILGEENKHLFFKIREDETSLAEVVEKINSHNKELYLKIRSQDNLYTDIANRIGENIFGTRIRTYRKDNARNDFLELKSKELLSEIELINCNTTIRQQRGGLVDELNSNDFTEAFESLMPGVITLLKTTVETVIIERLKDNPDISQWVEVGYQLHREKNSCICEFCNQPLPEERIRELAAYFNEEDKQLKAAIDELLEEINKIYLAVENIHPPDKANFYSDLQMAYQASVDLFSTEKKHLLIEFETLKKEVKAKKLHTSEELLLKTSIDMREFLSALNDVNAHIKSQNEKTHNFEEKRRVAEQKLKKHYLSEIWDQVKKLDFEISELDQTIEKLKNGEPDNPDFLSVAHLEKRITENKNKLFRYLLACDELNQKITDFLGRGELVFECEEEGYIIKHQHGEIAKNLSEGEKTAIAFVHFIISLQESDFDLENGIVVIDDPISSLDSNSLFQAFAFLKNSVKDAHQIFILTHNFSFLRLVIRWYKNLVRFRRVQAGYFMINNSFENNMRIANILELDRLLKDYNNEYHYLFKLLYIFHEQGTTGNTIESVYHLPNIARKFLEHFLMILAPHKTDLYSQLEVIDFCDYKKSAIYEFVNKQSHLSGNDFDSSLVPETQKNVGYLLEMIKEVFSTHFDNLEKAIKK
jgi:wobble nucleotide-excising tRNase